MKSNVRWEELKNIPCYTPLHKFPFTVKRCSENLYRVEESKYLFTVPLVLGRFSETGPFVTIVLWAESDGAAQLAMERNIEDDRVCNSASAPEELLLSPGCRTYSDIRKHIESLNLWFPHTETNSYRMLPEVTFIYRSISFENYEYSFRSISRKPKETPFAIQYRLKEEKALSKNE